MNAWKPAVQALRRTSDGGKSWEPVGSWPNGVNLLYPNTRGKLVYERAKRRIGYQHPYGAIVWTSDEGKTWL